MGKAGNKMTIIQVLTIIISLATMSLILLIFFPKGGALFLSLIALVGFILFSYGFIHIDKQLAIYILEAVIGYVSIGIAFGGAYLAMGESAFPGAKSVIDYYYFSFVTMTTLGYGDIHPAENAILAKILVTVETLISVLYTLLIFGTITKTRKQL